MGEWTNVYDWIVSVIGEPPTPYNTGQTYSTTWSPTEVLAYATACCVVLLAFRVLFWAIRKVFGGAS